MVHVTDKKGKTIHRMRLDPGFASLFLLYWYCCWKRQFCNTINTHTHDTISAGGYTRQSNSHHYTNTYANTNTTADADTYSKSYANTNNRSYRYASANATPETNCSSMSGHQWEPLVL